MTERRYIDVPAEHLEAAGRALFGDAWMAGLSEVLGWDKVRLRQVLRGSRPMPTGAVDEIVHALQEQARAIVAATMDLQVALAK